MAGAVSAAVRLVRGLTCPQCGAAIELRGGSHTRSAVCGNCQTVLDASDPSLAVLHRFDDRARIEPAIPLGTRGTLHGAAWEVIGFQVRTIFADGEQYSWREYLLFNPYRGYRYLTEYDGHWNDVAVVRALPTRATVSGRPVATLSGATFKHFQRATARTTFVLGEFPWEVRVDDEVVADDFVATPRLLSAEATGDEVSWSIGDYIEPQVVWRAFSMKGAPPRRTGVFANQPNPFAPRVRATVRLAGIFLIALVALGLTRCVTARNEEVFVGRYQYTGAAGDTAAFVTAPFELHGREANVAIELWADVDNSSIAFDVGLVNDVTGDVRDLEREVSHYHGVQDGESWSEGSKRDRVLLPRVPRGRYYLRVRPEGAQPALAWTASGGTVPYSIRVRRDVPRPGYWFIALAMLMVPALWPMLRSASFEQSRWAQSDYAPTSSEDDDDGGDDE